MSERVDLWQYNYRVHELVAAGDFDAADRFGAGTTRRARRSVATAYDSLAFAEAAVNLAYARYRLERYEATVRAYDAADGFYHHLPDTLQMRLLRWAAEASRAAGEHERAYHLAGRAVQMAYHAGDSLQLAHSLACFGALSPLPAPPTLTDSAAGLALTAFLAGLVVGLLLLWPRLVGLVVRARRSVPRIPQGAGSGGR